MRKRPSFAGKSWRLLLHNMHVSQGTGPITLSQAKIQSVPGPGPFTYRMPRFSSSVTPKPGASGTTIVPAKRRSASTMKDLTRRLVQWNIPGRMRRTAPLRQNASWHACLSSGICCAGLAGYQRLRTRQHPCSSWPGRRIKMHLSPGSDKHRLRSSV